MPPQWVECELWERLGEASFRFDVLREPGKYQGRPEIREITWIVRATSLSVLFCHRSIISWQVCSSKSSPFEPVEVLGSPFGMALVV